jgi:hypothetical protein
MKGMSHVSEVTLRYRYELSRRYRDISLGSHTNDSSRSDPIMGICGLGSLKLSTEKTGNALLLHAVGKEWCKKSWIIINYITICLKPGAVNCYFLLSFNDAPSMETM